MKRFRCGDVVPGCTSTFVGSEHDVLDRVARHAREDHGLAEVTADLVDAVRGAMHPA